MGKEYCNRYSRELIYPEKAIKDIYWFQGNMVYITEKVVIKEPGYMSKRNWNRMVMDGSIPDHLLFSWIDDSYHLVKAKLTKGDKLKYGLK